MLLSRQNIIIFNVYIIVYLIFIILLSNVIITTGLSTVKTNLPISSATSSASSSSSSSSAVATVKSFNNRKFQIYRLPKDTIPLEYNLHLQTDIHRGQFEFYGFVNIRIVCKNITNKIYLNVKLLKNYGISLIDLKSGENYENLQYETDNYSILIINTIIDLIQDREYLLRISYQGELTDETNGFYKTFYMNSYGDKVWVAVTQFQPFYARKAFPCYDEPEFKAKFTLAVTHGTNYTVLSNMPAESVPDENGYPLRTTRFRQTPPMSTYTLAFIVSNYENRSQASGRTLHSVYIMSFTRSLTNLIDLNQNYDKYNYDENELGNYEIEDDTKKITSWQFSMNISIKCLNVLNDYFNSYTSIRYPFKEIKHISLPDEYSNGHASWSLLTHNPNHLFDFRYKDVTVATSAIDYNDDMKKLRSLIVMTKKLAQQWFGNLITPKWWNCNWISEGFSTFYAYIIANETFPNWHIDDFAIFDMVDASYYIWDENDIPLNGEINTESEILTTQERFYAYKAANIFRMFYYTLTPKAFHQAVSAFLKDMEYSAIDENDLFKYFQMAARNFSIQFFKDDNAITKSFSSWTHRSGYPILTVTRNYETGSFTIQQESNRQEFQNLWWLPLTFITSIEMDYNQNDIEFFLPKIHSATINPAIGKLKLLPGDWLLLNKLQTCYYIVNYDTDNWKLLSRALLDNPSILHDYNKVQILRDLNILADKEIISIGIAMEMLRFLKRERSLTTWNGATFLIQNLLWKLQGHSSTELDFEQYAKELIEPIFKSLDFYQENDVPYYRYIKYNIFNLACRCNLNECKKIAEIEFNKYMSENLPIQPNYLSRSILCSNIRSSNIESFRQVYEKLLSLKKPNERDDLIYALSCSLEIELSEFFINSIAMSNHENFTQIEKSTAIYYSYFNSKINRQTILQILTKYFLKFIRLPSDLSKIFQQKSWYYHASESKRIYKDLKFLNKYLLTTPKDRPMLRVYSTREYLPDKVEEELLKWLKDYKNQGNYFSASHKLQISDMILLIIVFIFLV